MVQLRSLCLRLFEDLIYFFCCCFFCRVLHPTYSMSHMEPFNLYSMMYWKNLGEKINWYVKYCEITCFLDQITDVIVLISSKYTTQWVQNDCAISVKNSRLQKFMENWCRLIIFTHWILDIRKIYFIFGHLFISFRAHCAVCTITKYKLVTFIDFNISTNIT